jgi:hypothetical protein
MRAPAWNAARLIELTQIDAGIATLARSPPVRDRGELATEGANEDNEVAVT